LGYGDDGLRVAQPVYLTHGRGADTSWTPELRTQRSARFLGEARWAFADGGGRVGGAVGQDWLLGGPRGAADWLHRSNHGRHIIATTGQLLSDATYLADYEDSFLARSTPWAESRALVGVGPAELTSTTWQHGGVARQELATLALLAPASELPWGFLGTARAQGELTGLGAVAWEPDQTWLGGSTQAALSRPTRLGALQWTPAASLSSAADELLGTSATATVGTEAHLLAWRDAKGAFEWFEPGGVAQVSHHVDATGEVWRAGPTVRWRRNGRGSAELQAAVPATSRGLRPALDGRLRAGGWEARAQGEGDLEADRGLSLAAAQVAWRRPAIQFSHGWIHADAERTGLDDTLLQTDAQFGLVPPGLRSAVALRAGARIDMMTTELPWLSRTFGARYTHPTGCLSVDLAGRLDIDRTLPDLLLKFEARPK